MDTASIPFLERDSSQAQALGLLSGRGITNARPFRFTSWAAKEWFAKKDNIHVAKATNGDVEYSFGGSYNGLTWQEKAEINLALLSGGRGLLEPDHRDRFLNLVQREAVVLGVARRESMGSFEKKLNRMEAAGRILRFVGDEGQLSSDQKQRMNFLFSTLRAQKFRGAVPMTWDSMRDAITDGPDVFQDQVLSQMAMQCADDMETNLNLGDTASADVDLRAFDGVIVAAASNIVASIGTSITTADLRAMSIDMPDRFARRDADLRWFLGRKTNEQLNGFIEGRATARGDVEVNGYSNGMIQGHERVVASVWQYAAGGGNNETHVVLSTPNNLVVGVWQEITFMVDEDVEAEQTTIYVTIRWTYVPEEPRAQVRLDGLLDPSV